MATITVQGTQAEYKTSLVVTQNLNDLTGGLNTLNYSTGFQTLIALCHNLEH